MSDKKRYITIEVDCLDCDGADCSSCDGTGFQEERITLEDFRDLILDEDV